MHLKDVGVGFCIPGNMQILNRPFRELLSWLKVVHNGGINTMLGRHVSLLASKRARSGALAHF